MLDFVAEIDLEKGLRRYSDWFRMNCRNSVDLLEDDLRNWQFPEE